MPGHVDAAIGAPERWRAALGTYRALIRQPKPPAQYAELHRLWITATPPAGPVLYLHGADDGCMTRFRALGGQGAACRQRDRSGRSGRALPALELPERVGELIVDFAGPAS
jgi:hypothetical protein